MRLFCICSALLPVFAGTAFGDGTYQRTKDGKTIVWNNDPKPGDAATWFGDRDGERYATKVGTLTWYTANGAVYARYFGNMVRGKLDGMVNVHSKGKTARAIFVDGQRTTRWAAGRAPSWSVAQSRTGVPAKLAVAAGAPEQGPSTVRETENALATASSSSGEQHPALSANRMGPTRLGNATARQAPNSKNFRGQPTLSESRTGRIEDTPAKELSEQRAPPANPAATAEPAPAESGVAEPEAPAEGPRVVQGEGAQPATSSSESSREQAVQPPREDAPSILIQPSKEPVPTPPASKKPEAEVEDSLQSLARSPWSLLAIPETAGPPEASPRLTKEEVINIANVKAHAHGYNRADYQRTTPQYNAAYKIWSVSYDQNATDGMEEAGKHFSVIVDDKTKGTVFLLRK